MKLVFNVENKNSLMIHLKHGSKPINETYLTPGQDFDILLIKTLDKIISENKIDRLSLKSVEISGKMSPEAVSSMILQTVAKALAI